METIAKMKEKTMKKIQKISTVILVLALIMLVLNFIILPLADWIVRTAGVILLAALCIMVYSTMRNRQ